MKKRLSQFLNRYLSNWGRSFVIATCIILVSIFGIGIAAFAQSTRPKAPTFVTFFGPASSSISSAVAVPRNAAFYYTSGTVPPLLDANAPAGTRERYGDTYTQAVGTLRRISDLLKEQNLSLSDVIYLTCYLVPDPFNNNQVDYQGWFRAYGEFFNNASNPVKTARSTVGVQGLVISDWLVEIEAVAVYPR